MFALIGWGSYLRAKIKFNRNGQAILKSTNNLRLEAGFVYSLQEMLVGIRKCF